MTERVIAAAEHPLVDAIGHLSGRMIERRRPYALDIDAVFAACARSGTLIEINSSPNRRDLNEVHARAAAAAGVGILINTDSHSHRRLRRPALRRLDRAPRLAWPGAGPQHADLGRARKRAQAALSAGRTCSETTRSTLAELKRSSRGATRCA